MESEASSIWCSRSVAVLVIVSAEVLEHRVLFGLLEESRYSLVTAHVIPSAPCPSPE
jgi:hypothetical protein